MALQHDVNLTMNDGAQAVAALVARLVAAGHTIYAFGNHIAEADVRSTGGAGFGASALRDIPGAWVTVQLAGACGHVTFQRSSEPAGSNAAWWVSFTRGALHIDGNGTTVDTPAAAGDRKDLWGTSSVPAPLFPVDNAAVGWRFHCAAQDAYPFGWWCHAANVGTGEGRTLLAMDPVAAHPDDTTPYVFLAQCRSGHPWVGMCELDTDINACGARTWHRHGLSGASWVRGFLPSLIWAGGQIIPRYLGLNPYDAKDELLYVMHFYDDAVGSRFFKGVSLMTVHVGTGRPNQHTFNPDGAGDDRIVIGDLALPWPAGVAAVV